MFPMTFVLYCDDKKLWHNVCLLLQSYGMFFSHLCIVLNIKDHCGLTNDFPEVLQKRLTILYVPGGLMMGSALNKMLVQLRTERFLLLDARYGFKEGLLDFLKNINHDIYNNTQIIFSLQHRPELRHWALSWPQKSPSHMSYGIECQYVPLLCWGGLFLSVTMLSGIGGFEQQLSFDTMMIDLSWRLQHENAILAETANSYVVTEKNPKIYLPTIKNKFYLLKKYFNIYPRWLRFLKDIWHNKTSKNINPELF